MQIVYTDDKLQNTVVALGNFDGLHIAHQEIIRRCTAYGKEHGIQSGVLLFANHTGDVLGEPVRLLTSLDEKIACIADLGVDFIYVIPFDKTMMQKTPAEFIDFLQNTLKIKAVSVGYDYKFGFSAAGDVKTLQESKLDVLVTDPVRIGEQIVSSTHIRKLIAAGDVKTAAEFLNRPYCVEGKVHGGLQNGRKMGLPTANLAYSAEKLLPADGVYKAITYVDGIRYKSAVNIGKNPTFDAKQRTVESFILDFDRDIYEENIRIAFLEKIRDEIKFQTPAELITQIRKDIEQAGKED